MDSIEPIYIHLDTGSEVVLDSMYTFPIAFCDVSGYVEGRHGMLFTTNYLLLVGKNLSKLFGFVYLCLGRVRVGFAAGA